MDLIFPRNSKKKYFQRKMGECLDCIYRLRNIAFMKDKKKQEGSGSVKIDPLVYKEAADHCKDNGLKITFFTTEAVKEKLQKEKK